MSRSTYDIDNVDGLYNLNTSEFICSSHIDDNFIKKHIRSRGKKGKCSYCYKTRNVVELAEVLKLIITGIEYLYEDANDALFYDKDGEHGYNGDTIDFYDLWHDNTLNLDINNDILFENIYKYLENDKIYYLKDMLGSELDELNNIWNYFKEIVKYKARFVFYYKQTFSNFNLIEPTDILKNVQKAILNLDLIKEIKVNQKLFRCRQHKNKNEIKSVTDMASAPKEYSKSIGRMNPAGISMFYCSKNKDLTIKEVVNFEKKEKPYYTTGIFRTKNILRLVDFSWLPEPSSIYDGENNQYIDTIHFLKGFVEDITKPIDEDDSVIEYIPTQIVTEYIRYNPQLKADGIIYPSSKDKEQNNIVLFYDSEGSIEHLSFDMKSLKRYKI